MAILAFGTSPADFFDGSPSGIGGSTSYRAPYVEESIFLNNDSGVEGFLEFPTTADAWISFSVGFTADQTSDPNGCLRVYGDDGNILFRFANSSYKDMDYQYDIGAGFVQFGTYRTSGRVRFDLRVFVDASGGQIEVYVNGSHSATASGIDTTKSGAISGVSKIGIRGSNHSADTYMCALFVADEDTRNIEYVQLKPDTSGVHSDFTGGLTEVDGNGFDDATSAFSLTSGHKLSLKDGSLTTDFDSGYDVVGVGVAARAFKGTAAAYDLKALIRSGSVEEVGPAWGIAIAKDGYQTIWDVNPETSAAWTVAEAKAAEFGVQVHTTT